MIDWKEDKRPAKNGWVPGDYMALCLSCRDRFIGAKRCVTCADCAYTLSDPTPQPSVPFQVGDIVSFQRVFAGIDRALVEEVRDGEAFLRKSDHEWDARWMPFEELRLVSRTEQLSVEEAARLLCRIWVNNAHESNAELNKALIDPMAALGRALARKRP